MASAPQSIAPQQNWSDIENRLRAEDAVWLRSLGLEERFNLYQDLFQLLLRGRQDIPGDWQRLAGRQWEEKLEIRRRMIEAFSKLDQWRSERTATNDTR